MPLGLFSVAEARMRIRERLAQSQEAVPLDALLPPVEHATAPEDAPPLDRPVRLRSAWSSTLVACLELARQAS